MERRGARLGAVVGAAALVCTLGSAARAEQSPGDSAAALAPGNSAAARAPGDSAHAQAAAPPNAPGKSSHQYVGAKRCKACHNSTKTGAQYKQWVGTDHARAYEKLASDFAKSIAKKRGVADPEKSPECLGCHTTGYGEAADHFAEGFVATDGVQCESCHGPGKDYMAKKTMQAIADGKVKGEDYGLVVPTKELCLACHNEKSPTFVEMNYSTDSAKISHPNPMRAKKSEGTEAK